LQETGSSPCAGKKETSHGTWYSSPAHYGVLYEGFSEGTIDTSIDPARIVVSVAVLYISRTYPFEIIFQTIFMLCQFQALASFDHSTLVSEQKWSMSSLKVNCISLYIRLILDIMV
jgi:hypothetical protein